MSLRVMNHASKRLGLHRYMSYANKNRLVLYGEDRTLLPVLPNVVAEGRYEKSLCLVS